MNARRTGATGMHFGPLCSIHSIVGAKGRGWTGTLRMISSWMTRRVTDCPTICGCVANRASSNVRIVPGIICSPPP